jgi:hypothetical protein
MKKRMVTVFTALALIAGGIAIPPVEAQAAQVSVSAAVSPSADYQLFYITSDDWASTRYDLFNNNTSKYDAEGVIPQSGELQIWSDEDYTIYVYQVDSEGYYIENTEVSSRSTLAHAYTISYELYNTDGSLAATVTAEEGIVAMEDSFVFTAEDIVEENGIEYDLASGYNQVPVHFGEDSYTFRYEMYDPEDIEAYIYYVDDRGNVLDIKSLPLSYYGGDETFTVDQHITIDGREYTKFSGPDTITVNYFSPVLDYDIVYLEDAPAVSYPYTVKINYVDSATGKILGNQYETITAEDGEYDIVELGVPDSLEISSSGTVSYYHADQAVIEHDPAGTVRTYDVSYSLFDQQSPYYWNVRLIDSATGSLLGEQLMEVGVGETVSFTPDARITVDGKDYVLDSAMASVFERHYDDQSSRIQYVYYNEVGTVVPEIQTLNISFRSVSDNAVLETQTVEVPAGEDYTVAVPETYETENASYVRLAGQGDTLVHSAGTPQSDYTVYYRDVNDLQNVDTVVIQEETIYYDVPVTEEEIVYVDEVEEEAEEPVTVVTNPTTGETETYNPAGELITPDAEAEEETAEPATEPEVEEIPDEETPLANPDLNAGETGSETADNDSSDDLSLIEDEETPLADQDLAESTGIGLNPVLIGGIIAAAAALVIVYIVISKKRKENSRR